MIISTLFVVLTKELEEFLKFPINLYIYTAIYALAALFSMFIAVAFHKEEIRFYKNSQEATNIYGILKCYLKKQSPSTNLVVDISKKSYNASCLNKKTIQLNGIWIDEAINHPLNNQIMEYIKCTLLHELYHLKRNESKLKISMYTLFPRVCPIPDIRKKMIISNWIEELSADRYAFDIYNDKKNYEDCLRYKKRKLKYDIYSSITHPSWEIRYEFIHNNIPVEYKEVEIRYEKWIKKEIG